MGSLLQKSLPVSTLVVAIDPGKVQNRVWISTDEAGLIVDPLSLSVLGSGLEQLDGLVRRHAGGRPAVFAVEATGGVAPGLDRRAEPAFPGRCQGFRPVGDLRRLSAVGVATVQN